MYKPLILQMPKFEAERFCSRMNLKLGYDSIDEAEIFLIKFLQTKGLNRIFFLFSSLLILRVRSGTTLGTRDGSSFRVKLIWMLRTANVIESECYLLYKTFFCIIRRFPEELVIKELVNCREKLGFVCTLPWNFHNELCASRCLLPNGVDLCKSPDYEVRSKS